MINYIKFWFSKDIYNLGIAFVFLMFVFACYLILELIYEVNIHNVIDYDLYCVYKDEVPIGISKHTFNQHFKMKEKTND